jgi:hypothetical protein
VAAAGALGLPATGTGVEAPGAAPGGGRDVGVGGALVRGVPSGLRVGSPGAGRGPAGTGPFRAPPSLAGAARDSGAGRGAVPAGEPGAVAVAAVGWRVPGVRIGDAPLPGTRFAAGAEDGAARAAGAPLAAADAGAARCGVVVRGAPLAADGGPGGGMGASSLRDMHASARSGNSSKHRPSSVYGMLIVKRRLLFLIFLLPGAQVVMPKSKGAIRVVSGYVWRGGYVNILENIFFSFSFAAAMRCLTASSSAATAASPPLSSKARSRSSFAAVSSPSCACAWPRR